MNQAAAAYGVSYDAAKIAKNQGQFDHSDIIFLLDKENTIRLMYVNSHTDVKRMIKDYELLKKK